MTSPSSSPPSSGAFRLSHIGFLRGLAQGGAILTVVLGALVLIGWFSHIDALKGAYPGAITMKVNTAACFVLAGLSLGLSLRGMARHQLPARIMALTVVVLGGLNLAEYMFRFDLGIDQFLIQDLPNALQTSHPGRMAPGAALSFLLVGSALLLPRPDRPLWMTRLNCWMQLPVLFMSAVAIVGYAYDVNAFYRIGLYNAMSLQTAFGFLCLAISLIVSDLNSGITNLAISDSAGGVVIRRLLPTLPFTLFLVGLGTSFGGRSGAYDPQSQLALMVVLAIGVSIIGVATTASKLRSVDDKRKQAETELLLLNQQLELRVQERTEELEKSLREVKHLSGLLPICAWCKKIRDDNDYWQTVEQYMTANSDAKFTHSICPECRNRLTESESQS